MTHGSAEQDPGLIGGPRQGAWPDPLIWFSRAAAKLRTMWMARTYPFASFGENVWFHPGCHVKRSAARHMYMGDRVFLARGVRIEVCPIPGAEPPVLILEEGVGVQRRCVLSVRNRIHVLPNVIMGPAAVVCDHLDCMENTTELPEHRNGEGGGTIRIEEGCWIGSRARIVCQKGELVIGRHSVVGANCVITESVPPYSVVIGNPPSIVRQYDPSKDKWVVGCIRNAAEAMPLPPAPVGSVSK